MKKFILCYCLIGSLIFCSCKKQISFNLDYNTSFAISKNLTLETATAILSETITTNSTDLFSENHTNSDNVLSIEQTDITFTISSPSGANFDFLKSIEIYINADGLPERLISTKMEISETGINELKGELPSVDVVEYLSKPSYSLRFKVTIDQSIPVDYKLNVSQTFFVKAKKLKS